MPTAQLTGIVRAAAIGTLCALLIDGSGCVFGQSGAETQNAKEAKSAGQCPDTPPGYQQLAYEENYAYLRDRNCRRDLWDPIKYVELEPSGETYLSLGGYIRERYEYFSNDNWGKGPQTDNGYSLQRYMFHADLHLGERFRLFGDVKSGLENGRNGGPRPPDEDKLDIEQAFLEVQLAGWSNGSLALRAGRQEISLGSSRLVSIRESPNVRQTFDGFRLIIRSGKWHTDIFATKPAETDVGFFDDSPDHRRSFWGVYATRPFNVLPNGNIDLYYLGLDRKQATFDQGSGREQRHSIGARLWGSPKPWDYNFESLFQWGRFGSGNIRAWTVSSDTGYTFLSWQFKPRLGLKADVASGDGNPNDRSLGTFNALFPKGAYFSEADLIGPANFMDLHPSVALALTKRLSLTTEVDTFWRESLNDGIYGIAGNLVRTGRLSRARYIGTQASAKVEFQADRHTSFLLEYLHFFPGPFLQQTPPARNVNFVTAWVAYKF